MKYINVLIVILLLLSVSCGNLSSISVDYDDDIALKSIKGRKATFVISASVDNPTNHTLKLKKVEFDILRRGYTFAQLSLPKQLVISSQTNQSHSLSLQLYFKDPFALLDDDFDIESEEYTLTGVVKVGAGLLSKKMKFNNVTFNQLINQLENL